MNWMRPTDSFYGKYAPIFSKLFEVLYLCVTCAAPAVTVATGGATLSALTVYLNPEMSRQSVLTVFMVQNGSSLFGRQIDKFYYNIFYRTAVWRNSVERLILSEQGYREQMENVVKPYLDIRKSVLWPEREEGKKIYCERYLADSPKGVVMISHGFTETAEKYKEVIYYFVKKQYHVYLPEYCGHGRSYRLIPDSSLIYVDDYQRYVNDFLYVAKMAVKEIRDFIENGNIKNSVNYPACDAGVCATEGRIAVAHKNVHSMLSQFTTLFANDGINIENMVNKSRGDYAYTIFDICNPSTEKLVNELQAIDGVIKVRIVK